MSTYAVARLPLLSPEGDLVTADPAAWRIEPALHYGVLRLRNGPLSHTIDLRTALAADVSEETEINDIRKTLGRMALSGIGSSLFWEGRRGGIGAGLLDLSARGVEKRGVYGGSLVFRDTSVITFVLFEEEFEELIPTLIDHHAWAHWRSPMDVMRQGWAMILVQASQQWSRMSA